MDCVHDKDRGLLDRKLTLGVKRRQPFYISDQAIRRVLLPSHMISNMFLLPSVTSNLISMATRDGVSSTSGSAPHTHGADLYRLHKEAQMF